MANKTKTVYKEKTHRLKTKKPTGLSIARNGSNFVASWKIGDKDYDEAQMFSHKLNNGKWIYGAVGAHSVKKAFSVDTSQFYPTTSKALTKITVVDAGERKDFEKTTETTKDNVKTITSHYYFFKPSDFAEKVWEVKLPKTPSITATPDNNDYAKCTFLWSVSTKADAHEWFTSCLWETILFKECTITDTTKIASYFKSSQLGWGTGTTGSSGSISRTEETEMLAAASYTRWVRVCSRGPRGASEWRYAKYVYGRPRQAVIKSTSISKTSAGGYNVKVAWETSLNAAHPITTTSVQYVMTPPDAGMSCPDGAFSDQSIYSTGGSNGYNAATFSIDGQLNINQCLFVRVNTTYAHATTYGTPKLVAAGAIEAPTLGTIDLNRSTMLASVTVTNNAASAISDSFVIVRYYDDKTPNGIDIGKIAHGQTTITVQCPRSGASRNVVFGAYAMVGTATAKTVQDTTGTYTKYSVSAKMKSSITRQGGDIPVAPTVTLSKGTNAGTVHVAFNWSWKAALNAELSWADHEDAWESTDQPSTFIIDNTNRGSWNISGLEEGKVWYVRVRLSTGTGEGTSYGAYSTTASIDLSEPPGPPVLDLSAGVITKKGSVTASWSYASGDGTAQASATLAEKIVSNNTTTYKKLAQVSTAMHASINAQKVGWTTAAAHDLVVRVTSSSGQTSPWSDPVTVHIADPVTATITQTSLEEVTIVTESVSRTVMALTEMPMTVTVTGAGTGGTTSVIIERASEYRVDRPDETQFNGFEGEMIFLKTYTGSSQITITNDDLIGALDDEASYRIIATVSDKLGQTSEAEQEFEVHWEHQALIPEAEVTMLTSDNAAMITLTAPEGAIQTDTCDIYRLSVDRPQLIYEGAEFGESYVDPFPTIGEYGGHRIVMKTANGDYITADNQLAWTDLGIDDGDNLDIEQSIIDFGTGQVMIDRNLDISNSWEKDFIETHYLGGSVQGDWNPAITRNASVATVALALVDQDRIQAMRRLATYAGICHVRTNDGSSYDANVDVSESYSHDTKRNVISYTLTITRVDPQGMDGMTLAEWEALHPQEEE